ncbi:MAG: hypothetical protein LBV58_01595 [Acholeplasmatales bacterium]|nr:hypothetical protein [Acholeplasmatales bacterium]
MKKKELEIIKDYCCEKKLLISKDIEEFIVNTFPNREGTLMKFYFTELFTNNIIYRLNSMYYKFNDKLVNFKYQYCKIDNLIKESIENKFPDMEVCIWSTNFLSSFMNLQPYVSYTFIEVNSFYVEFLFEYLKGIYDNVFINPDERELFHYSKGDNPIIIRKLPLRSPLDKQYTGNIGSITKKSKSKSNVFNLKIEKLIVDIFIDKDKILIYEDLDFIIRELLKVYCVNFVKLLSYASYRNVRDELEDYINYIIGYDITRGEFYDK